MPEQPGHPGTPPRLYPPIHPFSSLMLPVPGGHELYVEQCGTPAGQAMLVLHGGPGGGCSAGMRRYFDPDRYRAVLFDQRGCGRSVPHAEVAENTTWHLVDDIERIRTHLGIERWIVFGGSWGATLALLYAQAHPDRVTGLVLRGVFTMTRAELDWFYGGGAGRFWPEAWAEFCAPIPQAERGDMIAAYHRRLFGPNTHLADALAANWTAWENALAILHSSGRGGVGSARHARAFARIENHYFINGGFLRQDDQIMADMPRIAHIPADIVQGRYDMICPPHTAHALHGAWPAARLHMIGEAGHAMSEPGITRALLRILDRGFAD